MSLCTLTVFLPCLSRQQMYNAVVLYIIQFSSTLLSRTCICSWQSFCQIWGQWGHQVCITSSLWSVLLTLSSSRAFLWGNKAYQVHHILCKGHSSCNRSCGHLEAAMARLNTSGSLPNQHNITRPTLLLGVVSIVVVEAGEILQKRREKQLTYM